MAQIESIVQPNCIADDVWRESVTLIGIHSGIVSQAQLIWQYPVLARVWEVMGKDRPALPLFASCINQGVVSKVNVGKHFPLFKII